MTTINVIQKEMTDQEVLENVKELHEKLPCTIMSPEKWKRLRLKELKRMGKTWSE